MARPRSIFVIGALTVASLIAAGCSSDVDDTTATTSSEASGRAWEMPAPNSAPMAEADAAAIDEVVAEVLAETEGETPGLWVGVWDPETGTHLAAGGAAIVPDTAATTDDHFRIGSVTKTFTAAAVLAAVDAGRLGLDDTVADAAPDLAEAHQELAAITLEQLLGMASGIPDYANLPLVVPEVVADPSRTWSPSEIIDLVLSEEELAEPGTPGYSTTNYLILGEILEAIDDAPVEEQLTAVAADAGLSSSSFTPAGDETLPDPATSGYVNEPGAESLAAVGATVEPGTDVSDWSTTWGGAGGGMYSTLADLGVWAASGFGSASLSRELGDRRLDSTNELPEGLAYGLGVEVYDDGWIGHTGQILGWEALALANTETGAVVVGATNETGSLLAVEGVIAALYPDLGTLLLA